MARIPRAVIDEVRNSVDIVDVIGRYVQLKRPAKTLPGSVHFTMSRPRRFRLTRRSSIIIVLVAAGAAMFSSS